MVMADPHTVWTQHQQSTAHWKERNPHSLLRSPFSLIKPHPLLAAAELKPHAPSLAIIARAAYMAAEQRLLASAFISTTACYSSAPASASASAPSSSRRTRTHARTTRAPRSAPVPHHPHRDYSRRGIATTTDISASTSSYYHQRQRLATT
jgi:hypothetical protein